MFYDKNRVSPLREQAEIYYAMTAYLNFLVVVFKLVFRFPKISLLIACCLLVNGYSNAYPQKMDQLGQNAENVFYKVIPRKTLDNAVLSIDSNGRSLVKQVGSISNDADTRIEKIFPGFKKLVRFH